MGLRLEGREMVLENNQAAIERPLELASCYVVVTDVPGEGMSGQAVPPSVRSELRDRRKDYGDAPAQTGR